MIVIAERAKRKEVGRVELILELKNQTQISINYYNLFIKLT